MSSHLTSFVKIGPRTSLYTPEKPIRGQLIIVCTWLGAASKHIAKYTTLYQTVAPGARILLLQSDVPFIISSYARQAAGVESAVAAVLETLRECEPASSGKPEAAAAAAATPQILLHVFSNGGTTSATRLLIVTKKHLSTPLPLAGLLCDSCPAKGTYWRSYDAMVLSLPKDAATRFIGALACHCILVMLYSWIAWGNENPSSLQRRTMLDGETVVASHHNKAEEKEEEEGGGGGGGRVCYFYSKEDRMCLWSDIKEHADEARLLGWDVQEIVFEGSGHCAHYSKDEDRYASAVRSMWDGSSGGSKRGETMTAKL